MLLAAVLYPTVTALDVVGPLEVLARLPDVETVTVASTPDDVVVDHGGLVLRPAARLEDVVPDAVLVPGGTHGTRAAMLDDALSTWLRANHERGGWTTSVCTGALVVAGAGLFQGVATTTHWAARELLGMLGATVVEERFTVGERTASAAGVSAGIDMALALAARWAGEGVARAIQLGIEYDPRPPFDSGSPASADPAVVERVRAGLLAELS